jgi:hypothetical protein
MLAKLITPSGATRSRPAQRVERNGELGGCVSPSLRPSRDGLLVVRWFSSYSKGRRSRLRRMSKACGLNRKLIAY